MLPTIKTLSQNERSFLFKTKEKLAIEDVLFLKMDKCVLDLCFSEFLDLIKITKLRYRDVYKFDCFLKAKGGCLSDKILKILFFLDIKSSLIFVFLNRGDKVLKSLSIEKEISSMVASKRHINKMERTWFTLVVLMYFSLKNTKISVKSSETKEAKIENSTLNNEPVDSNTTLF